MPGSRFYKPGSFPPGQVSKSWQSCRFCETLLTTTFSLTSASFDGCDFLSELMGKWFFFREILEGSFDLSTINEVFHGFPVTFFLAVNLSHDKMDPHTQTHHWNIKVIEAIYIYRWKSTPASKNLKICKTCYKCFKTNPTSKRLSAQATDLAGGLQSQVTSVAPSNHWRTQSILWVESHPPYTAIIFRPRPYGGKLLKLEKQKQVNTNQLVFRYLCTSSSFFP